MKTKHLLLAFVILFSSCNSKEKVNDNKIIGSWQLAEIKAFHKANVEMDDQTRTTMANEMLEKGLALHFYPDSSYTVLEGDTVQHGVYSLRNENELQYGSNTLKIERYDQEGDMKSVLVSVRNDTDTVESEYKLVEEAQSIKDYTEDPFYIGNNKWRQRPLNKETETEIVSRLSNYILHNAYLLKAAYERNDVTVSFKHSQGIIKIFRGGVGIVKENKINETWKNCFYDEDDAMKAFNLYKSYLDNQGVLRTKATGDWVKDDYGLLLKLYSKLQNRQV